MRDVGVLVSPSAPTMQVRQDGALETSLGSQPRNTTPPSQPNGTRTWEADGRQHGQDSLDPGGMTGVR
jgi:hypothetical protein